MKKFGIILGLALSSSAAFAHNHGAIKIHDARLLPGIAALLKPGRLVMDDGKKVGIMVPKKAVVLNDNLEKARDYFNEKFDRKSWDNKGSNIIASVNVSSFSLLKIFSQKENAAWYETRFLFGAGKKRGLDDFEKALDVVAHEYTHAVIQTTSNLKYEGESGALNEHFADVFGALINQHYNNVENPFLIGASVLNGEYARKAKALRDMMNPEKGLTPQPSHTIQLLLPPFSVFYEGCIPDSDNDRCGVHILSGIPNKMAAIVMTKLHWEDSAKLFYNVMTKRLSKNSKFSDYSAALKEECKSMSTDTCDIVEEALQTVGM